MFSLSVARPGISAPICTTAAPRAATKGARPRYAPRGNGSVTTRANLLYSQHRLASQGFRERFGVQDVQVADGACESHVQAL
ncbi:hypothetical protein GCM10023318_54460 [Nocardia callitridis]|uniref:Uncharacterized protein n=1 Tax=Nocardia callitridis TaxID=648753 RepID=A0ABP9KYC1_9NOCA